MGTLCPHAVPCTTASIHVPVIAQMRSVPDSPKPRWALRAHREWSLNGEQGRARKKFMHASHSPCKSGGLPSSGLQPLCFFAPCLQFAFHCTRADSDPRSCLKIPVPALQMLYPPPCPTTGLSNDQVAVRPRFCGPLFLWSKRDILALVMRSLAHGASPKS